MSSSSCCEPVIIVHGGAGYISATDAEVYQGIQEAAREGYRGLETGSALDAVERAVCYMEDNPIFNAGYGSKLNAAGELEMDAIIMEGKSLKSGAVAGVNDVKNPVKIARCVMEKTEHQFLIGKGLEAFIDEMGFSRVDRDDFITDKRRKELQMVQKSACTSEVSSNEKEAEHGTVGAVALDRDGNIACATSTGGTMGKKVGRVGDTPLIGCGTYCDNAVGGVSATGIGEAMMRVALAARVVVYMEQGLSGRDAATKALDFLMERTSYGAGLIVLGADREAAPVFSTFVMSWAMIKDRKLSYGDAQGEKLDGGKV